MLVDISSSMDPTGKLGSAEAIATRFLRAAHPSDEISAMEFSDQLGPFHLLTQQELLNPTPPFSLRERVKDPRYSTRLPLSSAI